MSQDLVGVYMMLPVFISGMAGVGMLISSFANNIRISGKKGSGTAGNDKASSANGKASSANGKASFENDKALSANGKDSSENGKASFENDKASSANDSVSQKKAIKKLHIFTMAALLISALTALYVVFSGEWSLTLFYLMDDIPVYFHVDGLARLFVALTSIVWVLAGVYAFVYMEHEGGEKRFFGFYLLVYAVLLALETAGNLVTLYFFYELMTLTSMPLVLHNGSREAIMAALKYLFYSMCGAYCALFGIYFLYQYCDTLTFTPGGTLNMTLVSGNETILLIAIFMMLIGFGAKAGMLPLHSWLTAAHPVAPAPASAVLSSIIVKGGVLAIIRSVYYVVGIDFIEGSWVQIAWLILALLTVFMGSMLAYREKVFKKRLAYSTVSQVSYILFGLALFTPEAFVGAILHIVFHACIKTVLFLSAGSFIFHTGKTRADEYAGIGKRMNITLWCYTLASLALIGIPPMSGFVSKWYLVQGALGSETESLRYLGPIVLLVSALLTAGYLLPVTMKGFMPGKDVVVEEKRERVDKMNAVLVVLTVFTVIFGVLPNPLIKYIAEFAKMLF